MADIYPSSLNASVSSASPSSPSTGETSYNSQAVSWLDLLISHSSEHVHSPPPSTQPCRPRLEPSDLRAVFSSLPATPPPHGFVTSFNLLIIPSLASAQLFLVPFLVQIPGSRQGLSRCIRASVQIRLLCLLFAWEGNPDGL